MAWMTLAVLGLGYVVLPLRREACKAGLPAVGVDVPVGVVPSLSGGRSHVDDISWEDIRPVPSLRLPATSVVEDLGPANTHNICVPTPLNSDQAPPSRRSCQRRSQSRRCYGWVTSLLSGHRPTSARPTESLRPSSRGSASCSRRCNEDWTWRGWETTRNVFSRHGWGCALKVAMVGHAGGESLR